MSPRRKKVVSPEKVHLAHDGIGIISDARGRARLFSNDGSTDADLLERVVESVNALAGYSVDQIRRGEFAQKRTQELKDSDGSTAIQGDGNTVTR